MRILIFGVTGKVGRELRDALKDKHELFLSTRDTCNLKDIVKVHSRIRLVSPDVVINAAAFNGMEQCDKNPFDAVAVNCFAVATMASACKEVDALFIHYSTDYVFNGEQSGLFEDTPVNPSGMYGWSKYQGEEFVPKMGGKWLIFRLSSIYGRAYNGPIDAINQALQRKGTSGDPIKVLRQFCAPTSARLVAEATSYVVETVPRTKWSTVTDIYNLASSEGVWKKDFSEYVLKAVMPKTKSYIVREGTLAVPRPIYTQLKTDKFQRTFNFKLPSWKEDFEKTLPYLDEIKFAAD